jgi:hypothetical protein
MDLRNRRKAGLKRLLHHWRGKIVADTDLD